MVSSDDESEPVVTDVSEYVFENGDKEPISFAKLPLEWKRDETGTEPVFLRGKADNGLRSIYKQVVAWNWKFDLSLDEPVISVLSSDDNWFKLVKPRRSFQDIIRTIQITVHFLHFSYWYPNRSQKALWDKLDKDFSTLERRPSMNDLVDHLALIDEAMERDETLKNAKLLEACLDEKHRKRKTSKEDAKPSFIVDDVNENDVENEMESDMENGDDESDEDLDDCFDSVCAICDNGGDVLICDGKCLRSFHATVEDGEDSQCESLGFTKEEFEALKAFPFYCKNCEYKQHQCFACGKLGSSDESSGCEVFSCVNGACGLFYHPHCVAKLLHPGDNAAAEKHGQRIAGGEQFACPAHVCHLCKDLEVRSSFDLQFAVCRRCPRAYHRKCLPWKIPFEEEADEDNGIIPRAWGDLFPNRVLIYCLKHEIDEDLCTPTRDHIKFPGSQQKKLQSSKKNLRKEKGLALDDDSGKRISTKPSKGVNKVSFSSKQGDVSKRVEKLPVQHSSKKQKAATNKKISFGKSKEHVTEEGKISLGDKLYSSFYGREPEPVKSSSRRAVGDELENTQKVKAAAKGTDSSFTLDDDARKRLFNLMKNASSSVTFDEVKKRHKPPTTHTQNSRFSIDNITLGKVEGSVKAVREALKKLDGGSVLDAKAVCGNDLLNQVVKWKERLRVYLSPFIYTTRYTSFGRHFTKIDKLKEIVDMLHWYVQDDDMLVDFCCGSNDFSCLMKKKLDEMGKRCSFKNYDILQPKNDFNFERRDWMQVEANELADGSQLIMGLNPPFGVNASLANKFINQALKFKPKLLILIVPQETERLDEKESPYDLVWEDAQMFVGKSFYLPGSVDVNDKQVEDWNVNAPVLYLWSRPDLTPKHKAIAEKHGHPSGAQKKHDLVEGEDILPTKHDVHVPSSPLGCLNIDKSSVNQGEDIIPNKCGLVDSPKEMHAPSPSLVCHNIAKSSVTQGEDILPEKHENQEQEDRVATTSLQQGSPHDRDTTKGDKDQTQEKNHSEANSKKSGKKRKTESRILEGQPSNKRPVSRQPSPIPPADRNPRGTYPPRRHETPSQNIRPRRDDYQQHHFNQRNSSPYQPYPQAGYNNVDDQPIDDLVRKYSLNSNDHPSMTSRPGFAPSPSPDYRFRGSSTDRVEMNNFARSYMGEMNEEAAVRSMVNIHGREEPSFFSQGGIHPPTHPGPGCGSPYGQLNPAANSMYGDMNMSAMQRYRPRLDEINHGPMGPPVRGPGGIYGPGGPRPPSQLGSLGFAPGPYRPFSQQNSSGWLND